MQVIYRISTDNNFDAKENHTDYTINFSFAVESILFERQRPNMVKFVNS